ncbi:MAG TPA: HepT-like ribonuclease domain-containing protein [Balneolaceae bacterium]
MSNTVNFLKHILNEIDFLLNETEDLQFPDFIENEKDKRAFSRSLEIIGEAIKNVPKELRDEYDHISWKSAAGLQIDSFTAILQ